MAHRNRNDSPQLLNGLALLVHHHPLIPAPFPSRYYALLARLGRSTDIVKRSGQVLLRAVACPLGAEPAVPSIYEAFAFSFLTCPDLAIVEQNPSSLSDVVNPVGLASTIIATLSQGPTEKRSQDDLLWLLSHFITLGRTSSWVASGFQYIEALYAMLQAVSSENQDILSSVARAESTGDVPPFVETQIRSLVDTQGISDILGKITR